MTTTLGSNVHLILEMHRLIARIDESVGSRIAKHFSPRARTRTLNISDHLSNEMAMNVRLWKGGNEVVVGEMVFNQAVVLVCIAEAIWMERRMLNPPCMVLEMRVR